MSEESVPEIYTFSFSNEGKTELVNTTEKSRDWPVVYLINNEKEIYIGETSSIEKRFKQHLDNEKRSKLKTINVIIDGQFNKSAILDIENCLIQMFAADNKFRLQNENKGQSKTHDYYQRFIYRGKMECIWEKLKDKGLTYNDYQNLVNLDIFKYSPFISLTEEQNDASATIITDIVEKLSKGERGMSVVNGGAGTGKTIVAINTIFKLLNANKFRFDTADVEYETMDDSHLYSLHEYLNKHGKLKIGFVVPMTSLRNTLKEVFSKTDGLDSSMIISPFDVNKKEYDVLFIDESHRLSVRKNITNYEAFDNKSKEFGLDPLTCSQLDWIVRSSRYQVLFYDKAQSIKGADIPEKTFAEMTEGALPIYLRTQMRCKGGDLYVDYLSRIFECRQDSFEKIVDYDFRIFDDVKEMVESIKNLETEWHLCRNVAGYSWEWISKGRTMEEIEKENLYDIVIGDNKYVWNMKASKWILSENSINEIGCVHTTQGYDLNYVGVIFGEEIDYDPIKNEITIDIKKFKDKKVKSGCDPETVKKFIINSYKVMMERGIKGCYVYVCNDNLRNYLKRFIE